jgi:hypothetical protein
MFLAMRVNDAKAGFKLELIQGNRPYHETD